MEKYNNWKLKFYTIWAGQAVSLITSAILPCISVNSITEYASIRSLNTL